MTLRKLSWALAVLAATALAAPIAAFSPADAEGIARSSGQVLNSTTSNAALTVSLSEGQSILAGNVTGLTASGATVTIEGSSDGRATADANKTWVAVGAVGLPGGSTTPASTMTADGAFRVDTAGMDAIRFRVSSTGTGNIVFGYNAVPGASLGAAGSGGGGGGGAVTIADGAAVTIGAKADAKSAATDTTPVTAMQVWKEISYLLQNGITVGLPSNAAQETGGNLASAASMLGAKTDAKSTATDGTSVSAMQVLKEISQMLQTPATLPAGTNVIGYNSNDPCSYAAKSTADFESGTSGGSIITAATSKKAYICSLAIVTSAAANVSLVEGTGSSVCTGGTPAGVYGNTGVTAANGMAFAANGGIRDGGNYTVAQNGTANYNVCVVFTTTNTPQVNVHVSYVQQ